MKKTFILVVLSALIFTITLSSVALASQSVDLDLSTYTDEEIVEILSLVNQEIVDRHIEKTATLPKGTFTVGTDIPAGQYVYTPINTEGWSAYIKLYENNTKETTIIYESVDENGTFFLDLNDGNVLESDEEFTLTIRAGALFQ